MSVFQPVPASRLKGVNPFRVMNVLARAQQLEANGVDVCHLEVGEPDFDTAAPIAEAGIAALRLGRTAYTAAAGLPELRARIASFYQTHHGVPVDPERILVTPGASGALVLLANLLLNPGDTVLMPDPSYPCNRNYVRLAGGEARLIPPAYAGAAAPSAEQLAAAFDHKVKGLWLASPANPTGAVIDAGTLETLSSWATRHKTHLMVDEIYQGLDYVQDASAIRAMGNLPTALSLGSHNIVVNSFSKYFGMTGWRVGWLVVPEALVQPANILAQNLFIAASTPAQYAALRCFDADVVDILEARREAFRQRRDYLVGVLENLGFSLPWRADGAFYCYADISRFSDDCELFCQHLLEQHGIAVTPGTDFGEHEARRYVRFAFTSDLDRLQIAGDRLQRALRDF